MSLGCMCMFFFSSRRRHTRCALVTGVQTCALPISEIGRRYLEQTDGRGLSAIKRQAIGEELGVAPFQALHPDTRGAEGRRCDLRSEERREGKECVST